MEEGEEEGGRVEGGENGKYESEPVDCCERGVSDGKYVVVACGSSQDGGAEAEAAEGALEDAAQEVVVGHREEGLAAAVRNAMAAFLPARLLSVLALA